MEKYLKRWNNGTNRAQKSCLIKCQGVAVEHDAGHFVGFIQWSEIANLLNDNSQHTDLRDASQTCLGCLRGCFLGSCGWKHIVVQSKRRWENTGPARNLMKFISFSRDLSSLKRKVKHCRKRLEVPMHSVNIHWPFKRSCGSNQISWQWNSLIHKMSPVISNLLRTYLAWNLRAFEFLLAGGLFCFSYTFLLFQWVCL